MRLIKKFAVIGCMTVLMTATVLSGCGGSSGGSSDTGDKKEDTADTEGKDAAGSDNAENGDNTDASKTEETEASKDDGSGSDASTEETNAESLKDAYADLFTVGAAVNSWQLADSATLDVITKDFSSITTENEMKPDYILDQEATLKASDKMPEINMDNVDKIMDMAQAAGLKMRGHTLVWHSQTPEWLFHVDYDPDKDYADRKTMLKRMESYISKVFAHVNEKYPGLVYAWDVVNEALSDSESGGLRDDSPWYKTIGEDYVEKAFEFARKYADKDTKLFINDYNLTLNAKRDTMYEVASDLFGKGLIDGIGMQSHHDMNYFNASSVETALFKYAQIEGIEIQLTELDLHNNDNSEESLNNQAQMYKELFDVLVELDSKGMANITNVTFWGLNDSVTWLTNFKGETSYPLLFDKDNNPKPCYYSILEAAKAVK